MDPSDEPSNGRDAVVAFYQEDHVWGDRVARVLSVMLLVLLIVLSLLHVLALVWSPVLLLLYCYRRAVGLPRRRPPRFNSLRLSMNSLRMMHRGWLRQARPFAVLFTLLCSGLILGICPRNSLQLFVMSLIVVLAVTVVGLLSYSIDRPRVQNRAWYSLFAALGWLALCVLYGFALWWPKLIGFQPMHYEYYAMVVAAILYVACLVAAAL
jgi:hypothetical protein